MAPTPNDAFSTPEEEEISRLLWDVPSPWTKHFAQQELLERKVLRLRRTLEQEVLFKFRSLYDGGYLPFAPTQEDIEDIVSEGLLSYVRKLEKGGSEYEANFYASIRVKDLVNKFGIDKRKEHDQITLHFLASLADVNPETVIESVSRQELLDILSDVGTVLEGILDKHEIQVLLLRYWYHYTYEEIAGVFLRHPSSIRAWTHRILRKVRHQTQHIFDQFL